MKLLCLSNGHGEDAIALRILQHLQQHPSQPELVALPMVGEGHAYAQQGVAIAGPVKRMPSGGFIHTDSRQLARDLRGGLVQLTLAQFKVVREWAKQGGAILAVGDIVPLLFAYLSGAPYAFVGTAKSEYYLRDEAGWLPRKTWFDDRLERWWGTVYHPWERWLMSRPQCKAVFPRDPLTTEVLRKWDIPAFDLGNPMMDGLEPTGVQFLPTEETLEESDRPLTFVLIPGSRPPEAYANWQQILTAVSALIPTFRRRKLLFLGAIAPSIDRPSLESTLLNQNWVPSTHPVTDVAIPTGEEHPTPHTPYPTPSIPHLFTQANATLILSSAFADCLHQADFAIAMAGTATEQFVGLGKPALILPGKGPQFTPAFAEAQTRLLGPSVILVKQPDRLIKTVHSLLQDPDRLQLIAENGRRRMGEPGAAERIAHCLVEKLEVGDFRP